MIDCELLMFSKYQLKFVYKIIEIRYYTYTYKLQKTHSDLINTYFKSRI